MACASISSPSQARERAPPVSVVPPDKVWQEGGEWVVDPVFVGASLGLSAEAFRHELRAGRVAGSVERGQGDDAGRTRLTFRYGDRVWAVRIEPDGTLEEISPHIRDANAVAWLQGRGRLR